MRRTTFCLVLAGLAACGSPPEAAPPVAEALAFRVPTDAEIPEGPVGVSIRRGRAILASTRDSLPDYVGNRLNCTSCHLENGTLPHAAPWVGIYSRFPQYRSRTPRSI